MFADIPRYPASVTRGSHNRTTYRCSHVTTQHCLGLCNTAVALFLSQSRAVVALLLVALQVGIDRGFAFLTLARLAKPVLGPAVLKSL